ncbi:uncharacterized protein TNCV_3194201 [Trichonephila clavipes]|uniref:SWIM-type domain-containing protein n=1 Tax=Trichonephila clavipes TaxID=2585209 RepID=A0A8X6V0C6_TRICX|nr:uncharacterized protein TNCV_3194201 [Trichonephila clavipes]
MYLVPKMPAFLDKQAQSSIEGANETGICHNPNIEGYCQCKVGARVVSCCAHVVIVLWFLGYWCHNYTQTKTPSLGYADIFQDTANGWSSDDSASESENIHWCAKIKDEVEKLAYQLNEEAERTERPIRRLSKVMYGSTCADMQVDVMRECLSSIKHVVGVRSVFLAKRLHAV